MKRVALLNSYKSFSGLDKKSAVCKFLAGPDNIGNLIYLEFIGKHLDNCDFVSAEDVISQPARFKENYDILILPFSNMLSPYFEHPIAKVLYDEDINVLLLSIGVQAPLNSPVDSISLSEDALSLLYQAKRSNTEIGVRGNISRRLLARYSIDSTVIGCPSVLGVNEEIFEIKSSFKNKIVANCTLNGAHKELSSKIISFALKNCSGYALQDESRIIRDIYDLSLDEIPFGSFKNSPYHSDLVNKLFDYGYYNNGEYEWGRVRDFFRRFAFFSLSTEEWAGYLENFTCSIGTRFHGNIFAMHCGLPSIFIPCDLRTLELIEYHNLPSVENVCEFYDLDQDRMMDKSEDFRVKLNINRVKFLDFIKNVGLAKNWKM